MFAGPFDQVVANVKRYDRATSDFNIKYRWSFGANYELPWGKDLKGLAGQVLGGWQTNGTVTWQTGLPFTVTNQQNVSGVIGGGGERPNLLAQNLRVSNPTVGIAGQFLDPAAFALPATVPSIAVSGNISPAEVCRPTPKRAAPASQAARP